MADASERDDLIATQRARWLELIGDDAVLTSLIRRHRERHRRYHTIDHALAVVGTVEELAASEPVSDLAAIVAAAWFHDAVYEPRSPANERASARLARRDLTRLGWSSDRADRVGAMIEGTADHRAPADIDTAVLFDADLAILGATPERYARYVVDVRGEYAHVDDQDWETGRGAVLDGFLAREAIFATPTGVERWERNARSNIAGEARSLRR